jgi:energy-coupling factor transport system ATP-binding protein
MRIEVKELHFTYPGGVEALRGINVEINSGERVAIIGQNGGGKTTLVRHFNGLLKPTQGTVLVGDWDTRQFPVAKLAARVGYVFQNPDEQLFCKTVADEIAFGPRNLGYPGEKVQNQVEGALALTGLVKERDTNPYDLSPTWRKMVALASVIAMDTPIVIFDEPTTGQDASTIERIAHLIDTLHQRGKSIITITHDIDFCAENFERIIALAEGQVLLDGPRREVIRQEETLALTWVEPPQLTRLAKQLKLADTPSNQDEFLEYYRSWLKDQEGY